MAVQNIECQIAQGQITRYLSGDAFPTEVVTELEKHIADCPHCQGIVTQKRAILQQMLRTQQLQAQPETPVHAIVEIPESEPTSTKESEKSIFESLLQKKGKQSLSQRLTTAIVEKQARQRENSTALEAKPEVKSYVKPLLYSLGLAVVVTAMSFVLKDPTRLFGERALNSSATITTPGSTSTSANQAESSGNPAPVSVTDVSNNTQSQKPAITSENKDHAGSNLLPAQIQLTTNSNNEPSPVQSTPKTTSTPSKSEPNPAAQKPIVQAAKPQTSTPRQATSKPRNSRPKSNRTQTSGSNPSGIRVYDENGNPIR